MLIRILFFLSTGISSPCLSYFYSAYADSNENKQIIVYLSDFHDKSHSCNTKQQKDLISLLKLCLRIKGKLIIEDLSSINNDGKSLCCNYSINCCDGVLAQVAKKARAMKIDVDNIEYRNCRVASLGPLLNNPQSSPDCFKSSSTITIAALYKEIIEQIEKIKKYDDGKKLNALYAGNIVSLYKMLEKLGFNAYRDYSVAQYCQQLYKRKEYRQELENLCIFDSALLDMNIIHSIATSSHPLIFIVAGGAHVEQVRKRVSLLGYQPLFSIAHTASFSFRKSLNVGEHKASSSVPQPIDLINVEKWLASYIKK